MLFHTVTSLMEYSILKNYSYKPQGESFICPLTLRGECHFFHMAWIGIFFQLEYSIKKVTVWEGMNLFVAFIL